MELQEGISAAGSGDVERIVEVWEASVRATHDFVSEADIEAFLPLVREQVAKRVDLTCVRDGAGEVVGFAGTAKGNIDMLFIHPDWRGRGIGRRLVQHAMQVQGAMTVDVNEQNQQAVGFYRHMGFEVVGRSALDSTGRPYPLLHLRMRKSKGNG